MATSLSSPIVTKSSVLQQVRAYLALTKERVVTMILAVTAAGYYMGTIGTFDWRHFGHLLIGMALAAGGTLALNQYHEREWDALMPRTRHRPLPEGRMQPQAALAFGILTSLGGILYLSAFTNYLATLVTVATGCSYLFWYTPLKRKSPQCLWVGALPGALPPVAGWAAAQGNLDSGAWAMFAILFLWQMPHALAIAWLYREEYSRAGFVLLPSLHSYNQTAWQIILSSIVLLGISLLPTVLGLTGLLYGTAALLLGGGLLGCSLLVASWHSLVATQMLKWASVIYVPLLFVVMMYDKMPR